MQNNLSNFDNSMRKEIEIRLHEKFPLIQVIRNRATVKNNLKYLIQKQFRGEIELHSYVQNTKLPKSQHSLSEDIVQYRKRRQPNHEFAQLYATASTMNKKITSLEKYFDLENKKIILIGDDDLLSLYIMQKYPKCEITVLDIDSGLIQYINQIATKRNLKIKTMKYDTRNKLPNKLLSKFDCFITDSSHCVGGIINFTSRGLNALKKQEDLFGQYIIQTMDEPPMMTKQKKSKIKKFFLGLGVEQIQTIQNSVEYHIPTEIEKKFEKKLLTFTNWDHIPSDAKIEKFLTNFSNKNNFYELLPLNTFMPETIVNIRTTDQFKPPQNNSISSSFYKEFGPIYYKDEVKI